MEEENLDPNQFESEQILLNQKAQEQEADRLASLGASIDLESIQSATPQDLKAKGFEKFGKIILGIGLKIANNITPKIVKMVEEDFPKGECPNPIKVQQIINKRDRMVEQANKLAKTLDFLAKASGLATTFLTLLLNLDKLLQGVKTALSIAAKIIPPPFLPGAIPAAISDLDDAIKKIEFDQYAESKLKKYRDTGATIAIATSLASGYVKKFIQALEKLDLKIKECSPSALITPIDENLTAIANFTEGVEEGPNGAGYKGFNLEVEEVPFSPTVNRRRAIGLNPDGIKLIQTPLSFATNKQILINELKLIIDKDNLKAI
jgi:hypothetical protein